MSPEQRTWLIYLVTTAQFRPVRLRDGYAMGDVDRLLDRVVAEVEAGRPIADLIRNPQFAVVRWREGYRMEDVDAFLAQLAAGG